MPRETREISKSQWSTSPIDPEVMAEAERIAAQFKTVVISEDEAIWMRSNMTIRGFYQQWMEPLRKLELKAGRLSKETLDKDRQTVNRWESCTRPKGWGDHRDWPGIPIGMLNAHIVSNFFDSMKANGYADGTILSTKCHFATMVHGAQRLGLCDQFDISEPMIKRTDNRVLTEVEATNAYQILERVPLLQTAFVLSLAIGARPRNLFAIKRTDVRLDPRPIVRFINVKTGVHQCVPLCPIAVAHLKRLPEQGEYYFPGLGSPEAKSPEKSTVSRRRTTVMKSLLFAAGVADTGDDGQPVELDRPFQVCRSTAANWIEQTGRGMSSLLLGHSDPDGDGPKRVTRVHYLAHELEPCPKLVEAVNSVKWPEVFNKQ